MKKILRFVCVLLAWFPAALLAQEKSSGASKNCGCACCVGKAVCCCHEPAGAGSTAVDQAKRHPLKGVIVDIVPKSSGLLVKHEEIPGFMPAMTMLLKVEPAALAAARQGQAITAVLVQREDGFWLEDIRPATVER